jgi:hypothetical protein
VEKMNMRSLVMCTLHQALIIKSDQIEDDEMGRAYSMYEGMRNIWKVLE